MPFWLHMMITLTSLLVALAALFWRRASRSTPRARRQESPAETPLSELASLQADVSALYASFEKMNTTVRRLSSRAGMREVRERQRGAPPPHGTPKAELLRYYGMNGKTGPAFAQAQLSLERNQQHDQTTTGED